MNTETVKNIIEISNKLQGKVEFSQIKRSQIIPCELGKSINDLLFVAQKFGLYFYTDRSAFDNICYLIKQDFPTYVVCEGSTEVFEIKK